MEKIKSAIIGSGHIGLDLTLKIANYSDVLDITALVGIDSDSMGLKTAKDMGIMAISDGIEGLRQQNIYRDIDLLFDATSAYAHGKNHTIAIQDGKKIIDLTPAAIGPYVVPVVNMDSCLQSNNVNMVTCGGQAVIPIVYAIKQACNRLLYAEIVASISSRSAGPGTRANIDEFTQTTSEAIRTVGGAEHSKAIIILNPSDPPVLMRCSIFALSIGGTADAIGQSITNMVQRVQDYVPGYTLKQDVQFESYATENLGRFDYNDNDTVTKITVMLEVRGAGDSLPDYAGNLDIMTSAARATGEVWAKYHLAQHTQGGTHG